MEEKKEMSTEEIKMDNDPKGEGKEKASSPLREVLSWVVTLLAAFALAMVLKNYVIINATVPTGSMEHTIEPGDDLFGLRLAYQFSEPKRGDIVIFRFPDDETQKYVKRVIGLPGEKVTIEDAKIYINDSETCLLYTSDAADEEDSVDLGGRRVIKKKKKTNHQKKKIKK